MDILDGTPIDTRHLSSGVVGETRLDMIKKDMPHGYGYYRAGL